MPVSMTPTADGLATLARIRLLPSPLNPYEHLEVRTNGTENLQNWSTSVSSLDRPSSRPRRSVYRRTPNMVMLGVGGLGSWSAPC